NRLLDHGVEAIGYRADAALTSLRSSPSISAKAGSQQLHSTWRNRRRVGYQGLSLRSSSHRQSGTYRNATHVGRPSAPAKCATEVSDVMIRSSASMTAAVSMKASGPPSKSSPSVSILTSGGNRAS